MLEALQHGDNAFVTLTYDEKHLPKDGSLQPAEVRNWLKVFRRAIEPTRIRYFLVGEYGDETERPHYHAAIFGYPSCRYGQSRYSKNRKTCCAACDLVARSWGKGNVFLGTLENSSAGYIAGYVVKKLTRIDDPRLGGRSPEFCRMSLRPGIGFSAMHDVADVVLQHDCIGADVPTSLRHGKRILPLGRYLTRTLRKMVGREPGAPQEVLDAKAAELQSVFKEASEVTAAPGMGKFKNAVAKELLIRSGKQARAKTEAKEKIKRKRGSL